MILNIDFEYLIILESIKGIEITTCGHYFKALHLIKSVIFLTFLHSCRGTFLHFCFGTDRHFSSVTVLHCSFGSFLQTYSSIGLDSIGWDWIVLHYQMCCVNLILKSTKSTSLQTYHCHCLIVHCLVTHISLMYDIQMFIYEEKVPRCQQQYRSLLAPLDTHSWEPGNVNNGVEDEKQR